LLGSRADEAPAIFSNSGGWWAAVEEDGLMVRVRVWGFGVGVSSMAAGPRGRSGAAVGPAVVAGCGRNGERRHVRNQMLVSLRGGEGELGNLKP
jgi:hypothetical protein